MISSDPYTHEAHFQRCYDAGQRRMMHTQFVQAKRGPIVYCATIKCAYTVPNGPDCWTIETVWPEVTRITVPVRNVIACGGETCSCQQFPQATALDRASEAPHEASAEPGDGASNTSLTAHP